MATRSMDYYPSSWQPNDSLQCSNWTVSRNTHLDYREIFGPWFRKRNRQQYCSLCRGNLTVLFVPSECTSFTRRRYYLLKHAWRNCENILQVLQRPNQNLAFDWSQIRGDNSVSTWFWSRNLNGFLDTLSHHAISLFIIRFFFRYGEKVYCMLHWC